MAIFKREAKAQALSPAALADIQRAIDEQRLLDAGRYLNQALLAGIKDPRLNLLDGNLNLTQGHFQAALDAFAAAMRGDYANAEQLLNKALALKSEYYAVASDNLKIVRALSAHNEGGSNAAR